MQQLIGLAQRTKKKSLNVHQLRQSKEGVSSSQEFVKIYELYCETHQSCTDASLKQRTGITSSSNSEALNAYTSAESPILKGLYKNFERVSGLVSVMVQLLDILGIFLDSLYPSRKKRLVDFDYFRSTVQQQIDLQKTVFFDIYLKLVSHVNGLGLQSRSAHSSAEKNDILEYTASLILKETGHF